jgi:hypothetical protein
LLSEPGDFVGQGLEYFYTPGDGTFTSSHTAMNTVSISFFGGGGTFWFLVFQAPSGQELVPGEYLGATRWPFNDPDEPGLQVFGKGRGCNTLTGSFVVHEATYGPNDEVLVFRATFEQHCEGADPALFGDVRINAEGPIAIEDISWGRIKAQYK